MNISLARNFAVTVAIALATVVSTTTYAASIPVTVTPAGGDFHLQIDDSALQRNIHKDVKTDSLRREDIARETMKSVKAVFPNGVPSAMQARIKIRCTYSYEPLSVTCTVTW